MRERVFEGRAVVVIVPPPVEHVKTPKRVARVEAARAAMHTAGVAVRHAAAVGRRVHSVHRQ